MASDLNFVEYVAGQLDDLEPVRYRAMFGEYAVYFNDKVVGLICDNQLFVKPTQAGRDFIGEVEEAPPYPGAKPAFLIADKLDDREWLCQLFRVSEPELKKPKPRKKKKQS